MLRGRRERRSSRGFTVATGLVGAAAAVALVMGVPGTADAAATWTTQPVPLPVGMQGGELTGVSCPTASFCVAADSAGANPTGNILTPAAEMWNGSRWAAQLLPNPPGVASGGAISAISCGTTTSCVAIGSYTDESTGDLLMMADIWNGATWTAQTIPEPTAGQQDGRLDAISCASATSCTAVGSYSSATTPVVGMPLAEQWNGTTWTPQTAVLTGGTGTYLSGVSCASATDCTAVGQGGTSAGAAPVIERWSSGTWTVEYDTPANIELASVSCTTPTTCAAVGATQTSNGTPIAMQSNANGWSAPVTMPVPAGQVNAEAVAVSCVNASGGALHCIAAGHSSTGAPHAYNHALAEYFNGSSWAFQKTAGPLSAKILEGVSCVPGTSTCEAVGRQQIQTSSYFQMLAEQN